MAVDLFRRPPGKVVANGPICAFDFDSTLRPHRGKGPDEDLTARLLAKLSRSVNVVIFSNRSGKTDKSVKPIFDYLALVDSYSGAEYTVAAWAALGQSSPWRKATTNMWKDYLTVLESKFAYRLTNTAHAGSYYCGDAAGRYGDHAATDYAFAHNIGIRFLTPEQVFANSGRRWGDPDLQGCQLEAHYDNSDLVTLGVDTTGRTPTDIDFVLQEMAKSLVINKKIFILLVGAPASGKTTFATNLAEASNSAIVHFSEDDMRRRSFIKPPGPALTQIIADATHPTAARRKVLLGWARSNGYRTLIVHMETPEGLCEHLNMARAQLTCTRLVPIVAHRVYWKNLEPPEDSEADEGVIRITFWPSSPAPFEVTHFRY
jgi:bifunctional polynucleotide phosphatase/kinase